MTRTNIVFDFDTIENAFDYANFDDRSNDAYLDRQTGASLYFSTFGDSDDTPDDFDDTTRYVAIPDTRDFGLGSDLAIKFTSEHAPQLIDDAKACFGGRGGFRRFKDLLDRNRLLDHWHEYQSEHERLAILQWCVDNDIRHSLQEPNTGG
ncbi:MAG: UPF0158 family protein [bacterium]|nr:UPF0158 family protein [bacterium]